MAKRKKTIKTNAIRIIENEQIDYELMSYEPSDGDNDGVSVAAKTEQDPRLVYKTLVAMASAQELAVFIIPVAEELDLKKAAKEAGHKRIEMLPLKELTKETGYMRGGCSPVGMKKVLPTFIDASAQQLDRMIVSAGKIGLQMKLAPEDLARVTNARFADLIK